MIIQIAPSLGRNKKQTPPVKDCNFTMRFKNDTMHVCMPHDVLEVI